MIDWGIFNGYLQSWGKSSYHEALRMFIEGYDNSIAAVKKSAEEKDFHNLDETAHKIKSNFAFFGATRGASLALALEMMGKNKVDEDMKGVLAQLESEGEEIMRELRKYRKKNFS